MSEKLSADSYETTESSFGDLDNFDVSTLVSPEEHAAIKSQVEASYTAREQAKEASVAEATADVHALFENQDNPAESEQATARVVMVGGKQVEVVDSYHDKSANQNEWITYRNEHGQEVHTKDFAAVREKEVQAVAEQPTIDTSALEGFDFQKPEKPAVEAEDATAVEATIEETQEAAVEPAEIATETAPVEPSETAATVDHVEALIAHHQAAKEEAAPASAKVADGAVEAPAVEEDAAQPNEATDPSEKKEEVPTKKPERRRISSDRQRLINEMRRESEGLARLAQEYAGAGSISLGGRLAEAQKDRLNRFHKALSVMEASNPSSPNVGAARKIMETVKPGMDSRIVTARFKEITRLLME